MSWKYDGVNMNDILASSHRAHPRRICCQIKEWLDYPSPSVGWTSASILDRDRRTFVVLRTVSIMVLSVWLIYGVIRTISSQNGYLCFLVLLPSTLIISAFNIYEHRKVKKRIDAETVKEVMES
jgi:hypothetical protein